MGAITIPEEVRLWNQLSEQTRLLVVEWIEREVFVWARDVSWICPFNGDVVIDNPFLDSEEPAKGYECFLSDSLYLPRWISACKTLDDYSRAMTELSTQMEICRRNLSEWLVVLKLARTQDGL